MTTANNRIQRRIGSSSLAMTVNPLPASPAPRALSEMGYTHPLFALREVPHHDVHTNSVHRLDGDDSYRNRVMAGSGSVAEDGGFKSLFTVHRLAAVQFFAPDLITERGVPTKIDVASPECLPPDIGSPSSFCDVALVAQWADGREAVILLIEHWSSSSKVDLHRVLLYTASFAMRYPIALVLPIVLVTDRSHGLLQDTFTITIGGMNVLTFRVLLTRITHSDLPRLRRLQNIVAAVLLVLAYHRAVPSVIAAMKRLRALKIESDEIQRLLPFILKLSKLSPSEIRYLRKDCRSITWKISFRC